MNFDLPVRLFGIGLATPGLFLLPYELPGFSNGGWTPTCIRLLNVFTASVVASFPLSMFSIIGEYLIDLPERTPTLCACMQ